MPPPLPYAVVLGTAQDGGYPHIGCGCPACLRAVEEPDLARRVACLGIVTSKGVVIVDATPDFPTQYRELTAHAGLAASAPPRAILLTHLHAGHIAGLPLLGREGWAVPPTPLWATESCIAFLDRNEPFATLIREKRLTPRALHLGWDMSLDELVIQPIPVPHRSENGDTVAFRIEGPDRSLLYAPDLDHLGPEVLGSLRGVDVAILDGTFFRKNEVQREDVAQIPHPVIADTMSAVSQVGTRIVFTHLNHTNPAILPESRERRAVEGLGMRVAREGDVFELSRRGG